MRAVIDGRDSVVMLADRRRQVALFPGSGPAPAGLAVVRLAAHLADEGPGRRAGRLRRSGRLRQQHALVRGKAPRRRRDPGRAAEAALPVARTADDGADARIPQGGPAVFLRRRRGALHQRMGARFPSRIPDAAAAEGKVSRRRHSRLHGDRDAPRARRHRPRAAAEATRRCWSARSTGRTSSIACSGGATCCAKSAKSSTGTATIRASSTASGGPTSTGCAPICRRPATKRSPIMPA